MSQFRGAGQYKPLLDLDGNDANRQACRAFSYIEQRERAKEIYSCLIEKGFLAEEATEHGAHNVLIDCRTDKTVAIEDVPIVNDSGVKQPLGKLVKSVSELANTFKGEACRVRVFVNIDAVKSQFRTKEGRSAVAKCMADLLNVNQ